MELDEDVLFLIFEELQNDAKSLHSCLLVNRSWCVTAIPVLWRDPEKYFKTVNPKRIKKLSNVIFLHLSEESRNILNDQGIKNPIITGKYQQPAFNYISYWKYLNLIFLEDVITSNIDRFNKDAKNLILNLFINKNTNFIHLSIPQNLDYQLLHISGVESCISGLESFHCNDVTDPNVLIGLAGICNSIKKLIFDNWNHYSENSGIIKLIEVQKKLNNVNFIYRKSSERNESFNKILEKSLIKHVDTIQYLRMDWKPTTKILSYLDNLLSLEINIINFIKIDEVKHLENLSLPNLKILRTQRVPSKILVNLIENTIGNLYEINVYCDGTNNKRLIQAIYQNCPYLRYLRLSLITNFNILISELENLLNHCQLLNGLIIDLYDTDYAFGWDKLFEILNKSSPINLYKFKFSSYKIIKLEHLKLFYDNWKDRKSMLVKISNKDYPSRLEVKQKLKDLNEEYKEKGIIKEYFIGIDRNVCEDFDWT
ncbi:hypothetical protein RclHR1_24440002 [Rhizophagus clarus]|uniref:F-box domain-containing protein n=1 Tax=Rhizophagus clarus TaxID=94130 RepID=A0A2Z6QXK5_9GLOM|nr:hypothetical protein RclHR1_24440002 [Rhizophagus clarus]GES99174.1 hypothetical protein GLOIN_2v1787971 [Rhizophagus clarus]